MRAAPSQQKATAARKRRDRSTPAKPKPLTASYLRNSALYTLSQRAMSVAALRDLLDRRAKRRLVTSTLAPEHLALIADAVAGLVELGLVDDARYADLKGGQLARKGLSKRRIAEGLKAKGLTAETIGVAQSTAGLDDLAQARLFVEKKRLGDRRRGGVTPESHQKDLRTLARAGFSYDIARRALSDPAEG